MEIPVLCYQIRGCEDLVDENCGKIVRHIPSILYWNIALSALLQKSSEQRKELGRAGRQKMIQHYSRPVCVAEWLEIYRRLLP